MVKQLLIGSPGTELFQALSAERAAAWPEAALVQALHSTNRTLWALEDAVRAVALAPEQVAALKRAIDEANLERHAHVAAIDRWVDAVMPDQRADDDPGATVDSQSIGQMVDRLSILALKRAAHDAAKRAGLERLAARVTLCFDRVLEALRAGRGTVQTFDEAKRYGA